MPSLIPNSMEIWEVSLIPLRGTELLKEGDLECNNFGESNKVMNVPRSPHFDRLRVNGDMLKSCDFSAHAEPFDRRSS